MAVTFLPRLFPLIILSQRPLNPLLKRFLLYIPFTALGALIVRGVMETPSPGMMAATLGGIGAAAACSWFKGGLILSVLAAIGATFLILSILR